MDARLAEKDPANPAYVGTPCVGQGRVFLEVLLSKSKILGEVFAGPYRAENPAITRNRTIAICLVALEGDKL